MAVDPKYGVVLIQTQMEEPIICTLFQHLVGLDKNLEGFFAVFARIFEDEHQLKCPFSFSNTNFSS